ncbi:MAG: hypothetical protein COX37_01260 [Candidatus Nealsonbacteria bacterium CG23_combo_of_CG06-09_8_20_14_all_39_17]|uniref:Uncharacterized protein n=1 Tax=Candidatus Nealsonbacteria bacterium CG23_combo_of_CG06-09_8_20_14_all_39_17 TaxID=1974722 RepID=A0A2G9YUQ0_9BACT|nr:MAG: hypothetical protein COX37_01260 [Candidatus Nealsonbacteria bacterium CG23_combo_of_CG06-09_8_20_14_all_39_17]
MPRFARQKPNVRAGKKEGGWGEGIFARPRFPIPIFPPPPNFVFRFAKYATKRKDIVLAPPSRARTTEFLLSKILT